MLIQIGQLRSMPISFGRKRTKKRRRKEKMMPELETERYNGKQFPDCQRKNVKTIFRFLCHFIYLFFDNGLFFFSIPFIFFRFNYIGFFARTLLHSSDFKEPSTYLYASTTIQVPIQMRLHKKKTSRCNKRAYGNLYTSRKLSFFL